MDEQEGVNVLDILRLEVSVLSGDRVVLRRTVREPNAFPKALLGAATEGAATLGAEAWWGSRGIVSSLSNLTYSLQTEIVAVSVLTAVPLSQDGDLRL